MRHSRQKKAAMKIAPVSVMAFDPTAGPTLLATWLAPMFIAMYPPIIAAATSSVPSMPSSVRTMVNSMMPTMKGKAVPKRTSSSRFGWAAFSTFRFSTRHGSPPVGANIHEPTITGQTKGSMSHVNDSTYAHRYVLKLQHLAGNAPSAGKDGSDRIS